MSNKILTLSPGEIDKEPVEKIGGWRRDSAQVMYENPWVQVRHEEVTRPNGSQGIYGVVDFKGHATGIVAIDENENTWLVKQSRYTLDEFSLEIPEGGGSRDEDPVETAKRELQEETGLMARNWEQILTIHTSNSITNEVAYIFMATGLTQGEQNLDDSEDIEVIKLPLSEAINMVMNGEITDAMSVAALLRVECALRASDQQ